MITSAGKFHIGRFLSENTPGIARTISFGVGDTVPTLADTDLEFEVARSVINLVSYDAVSGMLTFKAEIPSNQQLEIREVGLRSELSALATPGAASFLLTSFDQSVGFWGSGAVWLEGQSRIGSDSLRQQTTSGDSISNSLTGIAYNFYEYSSQDRFVLAADLVSSESTIDSVALRFKTNSSNYYTFLFYPEYGYNLLSATKSLAVATGSPRWDSITEIEVETTGGAGSGDIRFEGLRVSDADSDNDDYVLVSREVLDTPFIVQPGRVNQIEMGLGINFS